MIYDDENAAGMPQTLRYGATSFNEEIGRVIFGETRLGMHNRGIVLINVFEGESYCFVQSTKSGKLSDYSCFIESEGVIDAKKNMDPNSKRTYFLSHEFSPQIQGIGNMVNRIGDSMPSRELSVALQRLSSKIVSSQRSA